MSVEVRSILNRRDPPTKTLNLNIFTCYVNTKCFGSWDPTIFLKCSRYTFRSTPDGSRDDDGIYRYIFCLLFSSAFHCFTFSKCCAQSCGSVAVCARGWGVFSYPHGNTGPRPPRHLPADLVGRWQKAGAEVQPITSVCTLLSRLNPFSYTSDLGSSPKRPDYPVSQTIENKLYKILSVWKWFVILHYLFDALLPCPQVISHSATALFLDHFLSVIWLTELSCSMILLPWYFSGKDKWITLMHFGSYSRELIIIVSRGGKKRSLSLRTFVMSDSNATDSFKRPMLYGIQAWLLELEQAWL